jgi:outer membrane murein-binding lipoprotein Lpp
VDQLEPIGNVVPAVLQTAKQIASQLNTVLMRQELMLAANEKMLAAKHETLELALAAKQEALAGKQEALAGNEKVLAAKLEAHAANERLSLILIDQKTAELASFKAQFEPRIMIDNRHK